MIVWQLQLLPLWITGHIRATDVFPVDYSWPMTKHDGVPEHGGTGTPQLGDVGSSSLHQPGWSLLRTGLQPEPLPTYSSFTGVRHATWSEGSPLLRWLLLFFLHRHCPQSVPSTSNPVWVSVSWRTSTNTRPLACSPWKSAPPTPSYFQAVAHMCSWTRATQHPVSSSTPALSLASWRDACTTVCDVPTASWHPLLLLPPLLPFVVPWKPTSCWCHQNCVLIWGHAHCRQMHAGPSALKGPLLSLITRVSMQCWQVLPLSHSPLVRRGHSIFTHSLLPFELRLSPQLKDQFSDRWAIYKNVPPFWCWKRLTFLFLQMNAFLQDSLLLSPSFRKSSYESPKMTKFQSD